MLSTDGGGTHWFQAQHRTHPPAVQWPVTETGSGLCGSLWRTSVYWSPQSHCLSAARQTCHLQNGGKDFKYRPYFTLRCTRLTLRALPIVSMVSLSSMRSCALGMSMCILSVCCCLFTVSGVRVFLLRRLIGKKSLLFSCDFALYCRNANSI